MILDSQMWVILGSVWFLSNKNNQIEFKKKTETGSNRSVSVRFGFLEQKPVQTGLTRFFSGLARFGSVFSSLARFFLFGFGSVRFFRFQAYKTEPEPNRSVFSKILSVFFHVLVFLNFFSSFISFFIFLLTPTTKHFLGHLATKPKVK